MFLKDTEVVLYCLSGLTSACDMEDNFTIPTLFELLKCIPLSKNDPRGAAHDDVIETAFFCIGQLTTAFPVAHGFYRLL